MSNIELSKPKEKWVNNRKDAVLKGITLNYNAGIQASYNRDFNKLLHPMFAEVSKEVIKFFGSPLAENFLEKQKQAAAMDESIASQAKILTDKLIRKFLESINIKAPKIAEKMVNESEKVSKANLQRSFKKLSGLTLNTKAMTSGTREILKASVTDNVSLIKSIASYYLDSVQKLVMRSITNNQGLAYLIPRLKKFQGITQRHATNTALDQTRKVYNSVNKGRMEKVGIKKFEWIHSGGGREPRPSHVAMNGKIYSFDKLPVINKEQVNRGYEAPERGIPAQAIGCRCTMRPVIEFED